MTHTGILQWHGLQTSTSMHAPPMNASQSLIHFSHHDQMQQASKSGGLSVLNRHRHVQTPRLTACVCVNTVSKSATWVLLYCQSQLITQPCADIQLHNMGYMSSAVTDRCMLLATTVLPSERDCWVPGVQFLGALTNRCTH